MMGQGEAFDLSAMMAQYGTMVLRQAYFYVKDSHKAEDVSQEVFLRMYRKQPALPDAESVKAYLLRVTVNVCKDMLKSAWHRKVSGIPEGFDTPSLDPPLEDSVIAKGEQRTIFDQVLELPEMYKDVVVLFYYHDLSSAQISKVLKIPEATVRTRLMRARSKLRNVLEEGGVS